MPRPMPKADVAAFYDRLRTIDPEPKGELDYVNPYTLLVAVALSAQSTDVGVNKATKGLFTTVDHPSKMLALGEDGLKQHIKTIGLYNTKAKNVIALSQMLMDEHDGEVPDDQAALERLPGVGRKTANVVRYIAFGAPTMAVDTHILRIGNRTGLAPGKTVLAVEKGLLKRTPMEFMNHAHNWLILHGRYICKARKPACWRCPVADLCRYTDKIVEP